MAKRYVYTVKYENKVLDKIDIIAEDDDIAFDEANSIALDCFSVDLEEVIDE